MMVDHPNQPRNSTASPFAPATHAVSRSRRDCLVCLGIILGLFLTSGVGFDVSPQALPKIKLTHDYQLFVYVCLQVQETPN
jgi:hypothetical protein